MDEHFKLKVRFSQKIRYLSARGIAILSQLLRSNGILRGNQTVSDLEDGWFGSLLEADLRELLIQLIVKANDSDCYMQNDAQRDDIRAFLKRHEAEPDQKAMSKDLVSHWFDAECRTTVAYLAKLHDLNVTLSDRFMNADQLLSLIERKTEHRANLSLVVKLGEKIDHADFIKITGLEFSTYEGGFYDLYSSIASFDLMKTTLTKLNAARIINEINAIRPQLNATHFEGIVRTGGDGPLETLSIETLISIQFKLKKHVDDRTDELVKEILTFRKTLDDKPFYDIVGRDPVGESIEQRLILVQIPQLEWMCELLRKSYKELRGDPIAKILAFREKIHHDDYLAITGFSVHRDVNQIEKILEYRTAEYLADLVTKLESTLEERAVLIGKINVLRKQVSESDQDRADEDHRTAIRGAYPVGDLRSIVEKLDAAVPKQAAPVVVASSVPEKSPFILKCLAIVDIIEQSTKLTDLATKMILIHLGVNDFLPECLLGLEVEELNQLLKHLNDMVGEPKLCK